MDFINALIVLLNYTVLPALTYGSQLALGAIFVTLIYGILRFANFATGDMMSFGTMFAVLLTYYFQSKGISFGFLPTALLTIPFAVLMMIFYMLLIDKTVFSYYRIKKSPPVQLAMVSLGVMFVTQAIIRIIIGPTDRRFLDGEKFILKASEFKEMTGLNEGLTIKSTQVITLVVTVVVVAVVTVACFRVCARGLGGGAASFPLFLFPRTPPLPRPNGLWLTYQSFCTGLSGGG